MKTNRRNFIQKLGVSTAALSLGAPALASSSDASKAAEDKNDGPILQIGDNIAVANTTNGKVRGYILRGINTFLGIPYGADTSGENRFMPPQWANLLVRY